ncbi:hypothetical protein BUALT_Bualt17G0111000 [Buddleja alternifolia]|uniref:GTD-binding domain-containing protein n=1 Tax=Buddleja alternifolia TaxID=168488 RepID=A0AAV6WE16_9LAMI|nr:hypothetical protein BUALT_Bualt17G0111000 [Buddleja alternifolia]
MAANKFATMLHRNTNKITLILIYALLEWTLILLLLFNSLFSYLIIKFAVFFGLKPPCPWCTRLDHVFKGKTNNNNNIHTDLLCELHAKEISNLGYCSNHHKLAESQDMCEDCLSSGPGLSNNFAFFPWIKEFQNGTQKVGEISSNCSCCGVSSLNSPIYSSYVLLKTSSWDVLECAKKEDLIAEAAGEDSYSYDNHTQQGCDSDEKKKKKKMMISDFASDLYYYDDEKVLEDKNESQMLSAADENMEITEKESEKNGGSALDNGMKELKGGGEYEKVDEGVKNEGTLEENSTLVMKDKSIQVCVEEDGPSPQHLEFFLDYSGHKLVPVELIDSMTEQGQSKDNVKTEDHENDKDQGSDTGYEVHVEVEEDTVMENRNSVVEVDGVLDLDINEEPKFSVLDSMEMEEDGNSLVFHAKDYHLMMEELDNFANFPVILFPSEDGNDVQEMARAALEKHSDVHTECEELAQMENNENEADVSIGTDIPDLDITDELKNQESDNSYECTREDPSTNSANLYEDDDNGPIEVEEQMVEIHCLEIQNREHLMNNPPSFNEIEEDKFPDTPTSVDSFTQLHKKLLFLEKRDSGTEESIDGSVTSELECGDGVVTVERLKAALRAERKALQALYAELEEERSASAVAANQTMAMINRLQEEKAAMQMEALQYQRMMDEQSEYDQEALQLLNELMVKREKELEVYRKKLFDYETKEKIRVLKKSNNGSSRSGFSSASCSNAEDSDGLSVDLNQEAKEEEEEGSYGHEEYGNQSTPVDAVVNLEESLADFEDERLSILAQLKVLEEKLMTLDEDNEQNFEDVKEMEDFHEDHGDENAHPNGEANGHANGFLNGKHHQQSRIAGQKGKSLLPLFDAISDENGDLMLNGNGNGFESNGVHESYVSKFEIENKKVAIEEEVDHLYERLQALEADKEFLKHCVSSLKKGDKGMDLLQEILQHLRDLRNVELRVRNISDSAII